MVKHADIGTMVAESTVQNDDFFRSVADGLAPHRSFCFVSLIVPFLRSDILLLEAGRRQN